MKRLSLLAAAAATCTALSGAMSTAHADGHGAYADCSAGKSVDDVSYREAYDVYACLADDLYTGYNTGDKRWIPAEFVKDYRNWWAASTLPANPGTHSERFLFTYVNETGADAYGKYAEGLRMPTGTVIAKESFSIDAKGKGKPGPLFIMQKVAEGTSPRTNDWYYMAVAPSGTPMAVNVYTACNECHSGYEDSDYVAYPEEDVRRVR